ncbi:hypothetical protein KC660_03875 [Candidatus Dojkabacteria bacterium]|uniref:Carbohydrate binding module xylan-binding domain-containing protein n=1 Tax=Candidatus Dojkabacteria bacterium TaxID=2099670 RepID=A0A955L4K1_9BACT|nr:hypothetical protein [Candidatus Dojkabacteria bacterium]
MKLNSSRQKLFGVIALGVLTLIVVGGVTANKAVGIIRNYAAGLEVVKEDGPTGPESPTYSCDLTTRYIDVSQCPNYATYANHTEVDSTSFFNNIISQVANNRAGKNQEVVIKVPSANFGIASGYIDFSVSDESGKYSNFTFTTKSTNGGKPNFILTGTNTQRESVIFVQGNDNFTIKDIKVTANNSYKFSNAVLYMRNNSGTVIVDGYECGRVKGRTLNLASGCFASKSDPNVVPNKQPSLVNISNSRLYDYYTGISIIGADSVIVENNTLDNSQASQYHDRGNLDIGFDRINVAQTGGTSYVRNNTLKQGSGYTEGETAVGLLRVNNFELSSNTIEDTQDTGIFFSSHTPGSVRNPVTCRAGSNNVRIINNTMRRVKLGAIAVVNLPLDDGACTPTQAALQNITISGNRISGGGTGISASASEHAPIYGLEIVDNVISNKTNLQDPNDLGAIAGSCLVLAGLQGKNNNPEDIKIHNNQLNNCDLSIYLYASGWPLYDHIRQMSGPSLYDYTHGHSRPNKYISVYENTIFNNTEQADILVQNKPVSGIQDRPTMLIRDNEITSSTPSQGYKRCNISCNTDNDCNTPITVDSFNNNPDSTKVFEGYPLEYSCVNSGSGGKVCRNSQDPSVEDCDLNEGASVPQVLYPPNINPGSGSYTSTISTYSLTLTPANGSPQGTTIKYTTDGTDPINSATAMTGTSVNLNLQSGTNNFNVQARSYQSTLGWSARAQAALNITYSPPAGNGLVISVRARSTYGTGNLGNCSNGYADMQVRISNTLLGRTCTSGSFETYTFETNSSTVDPRQVTVNFMNDFYQAGVYDRNLIVDYVRVGNGTYNVISGSGVLSKGQYNSSWGGCNNTANGSEQPVYTNVIHCGSSNGNYSYFRLR